MEEKYREFYRLEMDGSMWSIRFGRYLKPQCNDSGYLHYVLVDKHGNKRTEVAHRLVAKEFIANPESKKQVNHKDGNKKNNHVSNLEWCTQSENMKHAYANGLQVVSDKQRAAASKYAKENYSKKVKQLTMEGELVAVFESISEATRVTGINNISKVCLGKSKQAKGFKWEFYEV